MTTYSYGDGRVWYQRRKFESFELLLPYGMTGVTDPAGALNAVREPSSSTRRKSVIIDIIRGEPGLPEFQLETRLRKTLNLLLGLKDCAVNVQAHMGACDRPDNYYSSEMALHWQRAHRGDLSIDRMAKISGDEAPVAMAVPWSSEVGPIPIDFQAEFVSQRTIAETAPITALAFLSSECLEDCMGQEDAGENGYAATANYAGSPTDISDMWTTQNKGETWTVVANKPFAAGEAISDVVVLGTKNNHRIVVSCGTTDPAGHANIAYADVTAFGAATWVNVDVGAIDTQFINKMYWVDYMHLYAVTNDGYVYMSADGGATWTAKLTTAVQPLNGVVATGYGANAGKVWVVGDANTVYLSDDYGDTWTAILGPSPADDINSLTVTPDGTVFVGNDDGEIWGTYDDGIAWVMLPAQGIVPTNVDALGSWGDFIIWAAVSTASGGRVVRSTDGGASFRLWSLNLPTNNGLHCIAVVDPNIVFVGGEVINNMGFISKTKSMLIGV